MEAIFIPPPPADGDDDDSFLVDSSLPVAVVDDSSKCDFAPPPPAVRPGSNFVAVVGFAVLLAIVLISSAAAAAATVVVDLFSSSFCVIIGRLDAVVAVLIVGSTDVGTTVFVGVSVFVASCRFRFLLVVAVFFFGSFFFFGAAFFFVAAGFLSLSSPPSTDGTEILPASTLLKSGRPDNASFNSRSNSANDLVVMLAPVFFIASRFLAACLALRTRSRKYLISFFLIYHCSSVIPNFF
mmetsp:Transcript_29235/g.43095  ORF Transcript_29235/g.43095 Transcript_29235/m.43095 type:complete len:239 (+) Transcript_29235:229-945(+)